MLYRCAINGINKRNILYQGVLSDKVLKVTLYESMTYFDDVPDSLLKPFKFK